MGGKKNIDFLISPIRTKSWLCQKKQSKEIWEVIEGEITQIKYNVFRRDGNNKSLETHTQVHVDTHPYTTEPYSSVDFAMKTNLADNPVKPESCQELYG